MAVGGILTELHPQAAVSPPAPSSDSPPAPSTQYSAKDIQCNRRVLFRPQNRSQSSVSIFMLTHCFIKHKGSHVFWPLTPFNRDTAAHWPDSRCSSTETVCYFVPQLCRLHVSTSHHHVGVKFCSAVQRLRAARADLYLREHCETINSRECYAHLLYLSLNPPTPSIKHSAVPPTHPATPPLLTLGLNSASNWSYPAHVQESEWTSCPRLE